MLRAWWQPPFCCCSHAPFGAVQERANAPRPPRPNILIILADDLGYGDVQCYNPAAREDSHAEHGSPAPARGCVSRTPTRSSGVCSPSRYTLLTGRYHWRTRLQQGIVNVWGAPLIAPDRLTVAGLAKQHGYRTACIGKWHLGRDWPITEEQRKYFTGFGGKAGGGGQVSTTVTDAHRAAWREVFSQPIPGGPTTRGFDEYFGTDVPNWPPYCFIENDRTVGIPSELLPAEKLSDESGQPARPRARGLATRSRFCRRSATARRPSSGDRRKRSSRSCSTCRSRRRTRRWP